MTTAHFRAGEDPQPASTVGWWTRHTSNARNVFWPSTLPPPDDTDGTVTAGR